MSKFRAIAFFYALSGLVGAFIVLGGVYTGRTLLFLITSQIPGIFSIFILWRDFRDAEEISRMEKLSGEEFLQEERRTSVFYSLGKLVFLVVFYGLGVMIAYIMGG